MCFLFVPACLFLAKNQMLSVRVTAGISKPSRLLAIFDIYTLRWPYQDRIPPTLPLNERRSKKGKHLIELLGSRLDRVRGGEILCFDAYGGKILLRISTSIYVR